MMLVKQCRSTNFTSEVLSHSVDSMRSLKKRVIQADQSLLLDKAKEHPSQSLVASSVGWMKIWDMAGPGGTTALFSILKLICKPVFSDRVCPMVECNYVIPADCALCEHFLTHHTDLNSVLSTNFVVVLRTCSFTASKLV